LYFRVANCIGEKNHSKLNLKYLLVFIGSPHLFLVYAYLTISQAISQVK